MVDFIIRKMCDTISTQYRRIIEPLDKHITLNLREGGIQSRPAKSNGLWCQFLLPSVLNLYCMLEDVPIIYKISTCLSLGLVAYCSLFVLFLSLSSLVVREPVYGGCVAASFISTLFMYGVLKQDLLLSLSASATTVMSFVWLLRHSLLNLPKTFTIGEAVIVVQSVILFTVISVLHIMLSLSTEDEELFFIHVSILTVLLAVSLMITGLFLLRTDLKSIRSLIIIIALGATFVLTVLHILIGSDFMNQAVKLVFFTGKRKEIIIFWLILVLLSICALLIRTKLAVKATTVTRKTFHVLASLVFLSGILLDVRLMVFAAGIGLALIIFIEALRKSEIEPISSALQSAFLVYSDEKDCGSLAMTPLYLYVGLACPLLLVPSHSSDHTLELLSGVLSIGVGDTAASWFGSRFGFNKWPDSSRTMEGTAFNILSQIGTVYTLILFDLLHTKNALFRTIIVASVAGLVEAKTEQVDNLVLPLITMAAYQLTRLFF
ncbi:dolichol kinase [Zerene cesonia]|uniref:dolichol kinase n=1 Tax=Zerene cesonia TaxID=33412 RepID=UPI0018E52FCF|nr:dolichol kinase [Zerene cesonia]